ncbi:MAG: response regulator, partial [Desulfobacterales bacterium]|nr:response regulator [Desulfobacterales bacterium]
LTHPDVIRCAIYNREGNQLICDDQDGIPASGSTGPGLMVSPGIVDRLTSGTYTACIESDQNAQFWAPVYSAPSDIFSDHVYARQATQKICATSIIGFASVTLDKTSLKKKINLLMLTITGICSTFWLFGSVITFVISKRITSPLHRLTQAALGLKQGIQPVPVVVETRDEIGLLAAAFNSMVKTLHQREKALQKTNTRLEKRVTQRTVELAETNRKLRLKIREKEATEIELIKSREKYAAILENIEEGYIEIDLNGQMTFFSNPLCNLLGYSPEQLGQMRICDVTDPESRDDMHQALSDILKSPESRYLPNYKVRRSDQTALILDLSMSPLTDCGNRLMGIRIVTRDISERLKAEQHRLKLEQELELAQRLKAIGTLAGGVAHDYNNLLMAIQGNISLIQMDMDSTHPFHEKIKKINHCIEMAANLTKRLLGFARGGKYDIRLLNINLIIQNTIDMFGRTRKEIKIHVNPEPDIRMIEADQSQFEQVLLNIYINAWQAMPNGGSVTIKTKNIDLTSRDVEAFDVSPGRYVQCDIQDTGIGMAEDVRCRIFEPFFTTKQIGGGSGLGLASTYGIIKNHGGFITVDSVQGKGSTFHIFMPASDNSCTKQHKPAPPQIQKNGSILLIDDEKLILDTTKLMIERSGRTVITAGNGDEAIAIYRRNPEKIDLVILDMIMPGLSCQEVIRQLRNINPNVGILLSSGSSIDQQTRRLLESGPSDFIQKPYNMIELLQKMSDMLCRPASAGADSGR